MNELEPPWKLFRERPQNVSTSLEREVEMLQWRTMEGVCGYAKGKKILPRKESIQSPAH